MGSILSERLEVARGRPHFDAIFRRLQKSNFLPLVAIWNR
jgi:hypothetical protein